MSIYTYRCDEDDETTSITTNADLTVDEQIEIFIRFLLACGYSLPQGELVFIEDGFTDEGVE